MPETCRAVGCSNRRGRKEGLSFHRFPEDEERRRKWVAAVNRKDWHPTKYSLCNEHFIIGKA